MNAGSVEQTGKGTYRGHEGDIRVSNPTSNPAVKKLLMVIKGEMTRGGLMAALGLKDRANFMKNYLESSLGENFVEMTQPDSPKSPTQKYRLTEKGKRCLEGEREG